MRLCVRAVLHCTSSYIFNFPVSKDITPGAEAASPPRPDARAPAAQPRGAPPRAAPRCRRPSPFSPRVAQRSARRSRRSSRRCRRRPSKDSGLERCQVGVPECNTETRHWVRCCEAGSIHSTWSSWCPARVLKCQICVIKHGVSAPRHHRAIHRAWDAPRVAAPEARRSCGRRAMPGADARAGGGEGLVRAVGTVTVVVLETVRWWRRRCVEPF